MLKKTHLATNLTITMGSLLISQTYNIPIDTAVIGGVYLGSILPDIDNSHTKLHHQFPTISHMLDKLGHRSLSHSLLACLIIITPLFLIYQFPSNILTTLILSFWYGLIGGYIGHLIEDNYSIQGILWFWPLTHFHYNVKTGGHYKNRPYSKYYYRVGGKGETIFRHCINIGLVILIILYLNHFIY